MQGTVGSGARVEELTILQLAEGSSCENQGLPVTVCREARSCGSGEHETTVAESPLQIADMKYITLSSTPFYKASSPVVPTLVSDSSADWSVSMATPTDLRRAVKRETPLVITTDEEVSDMERTVTKTRPRSLAVKDKNVIRTLFRHQSPQCMEPVHSTASSTAQRLLATPLPFSPIPASPLLRTVQRPCSPEAPPTYNTSLSLISCTNTVAETPTRPESEGRRRFEIDEGRKTRRSERESVGLNRGFCEEVPVSSQELFESPDVFDSVERVPDSPLVATVPESPARPEDEGDPALADNQEREEGERCSSEEGEGRAPANQKPARNPIQQKSNGNQIQVNQTTNETQVNPRENQTQLTYCTHQVNQIEVRTSTQVNPNGNGANTDINGEVHPCEIQMQFTPVRDLPQVNLIRSETQVNPDLPSKAAINNFLYPSGMQTDRQTGRGIGNQTRGKRKREEISSVEPPEKKASCCLGEVFDQKPTTPDSVNGGVIDTAPPLESVAESDCEMSEEEDEEDDDEKQDEEEEEKEKEIEGKVSNGGLQLESVACEMSEEDEEDDEEKQDEEEEEKEKEIEGEVSNGGLQLESVAESDCEMRPDNKDAEKGEEEKEEEKVSNVGSHVHAVIPSRAPGLLRKTSTSRDRPRHLRPSPTSPTAHVSTSLPPLPSFVGFQTASGRSLSLSDKSLQKARRLLSEEDTKEPGSVLPPPQPHCVATPRQITPLNVSSCKRARSAGVPRSRAKSFKPPRPAGSVSVVEEKARVARLLRGMRQAGAGAERGGAERGGAERGGAERGMRQAGAGAERGGAVQTPSQHVECGFSTGSGRKLSVSSSALRRAQQLVATDKENGITPASATTELPRTSMDLCVSESASTAVDPCSNSTSIAPYGSGSASTSSASKGIGMSVCSGFQSASGRALSLSGKAVERARSLLADINTSTTDPPLVTETRPSTSGFPEARESSDDFYTRGFGREDLIDFTVFSQFNQHPAEAEMMKETSGRNEGGSCGDEVEEDCSAYFSTQAVRQFLHFTEEDSDGEEEKSSPQQAMHERLTGMGEKGEKKKLEDEEEEVVDERTASQTLMDELFGVTSPEASGGDTLGQSPYQGTVEQLMARDEEMESDMDGGCELRNCSPAVLEEGERHSEDDMDLGVEKEPVAGSKEQEEDLGNDLNHSLSNSPAIVKKSAPLSFPGLMTASGKEVIVSSSALSAARQFLHRGPGTTEESEERAPSVGEREGNQLQSPPSVPLPGLMTASGRKVEISEAALRAVRETGTGKMEAEKHSVRTEEEKKSKEKETVRGGTVCMGFQTAAGVKVRVSETALAAVRGEITCSTPLPASPAISSSSSTNSSTDPSICAQSSASTSSGLRPRIRHQFRPLATKPHPSSSSRPSVRYKPVFRRGQQAPPTQPEAPPTATPTPTPADQQSSSRGLRITPEGLICDRMTGRRPLTPVQTFLGPDGSYMSTPVHRHSIRAVRPLSAASSDERERDKKAGDEKEGGNDSAHPPPVDVDSVTGTERDEGKARNNHCSQNEERPSPDKDTAREDCHLERNDREEKEEDGMKDIEDVGECAVDTLNDSLDAAPGLPEVPRPSLRRRPVRKKVIPRSAGSLLTAHMQHWEARLPLSARGHPGDFSLRQLYRDGVHPTTVAVAANSASSYTFSGELFFSSAVLEGAPVCVGDGAVLRLNYGVAGPEELWEAFASSPGVDRGLVSFQWFQNHYRWLVWKLAAMETRFPRECGGHWLTPDWLMKQMRYRYDREMEAAERPALRRICERDDISHRRLVLSVSGVYSSPYSKPPTSEGGDTGYPTVEVTDGWYSLPGILDPPLQYMVHCRKLSVGTKIVTYGAELVGSADGCHPLEAPPTLCLRLSANSTRRVRWYARLGFQTCPVPFSLPLTSLFPDGGLVGCTEAVIARVYPLIYMEKVRDGRNIFRSGRAEEQAASRHQEIRQRKIEAISSRLQKEFEEELANKNGCSRVGWRRSRRLNTVQVKQLQDGEAIHTALTNSPDPLAFQEALSSMQVAMLESYHQLLRERRQTDLRRKVEEAVRDEEERGRLPHPHTSTPLLRVRLVSPGSNPTHVDCTLSVWQPREGVTSVLVEGKLVRMWNLNSSNRKNRSGSLQLSASPRTRFESVDIDQCEMGAVLEGYRPRECVSIGRLVRGEGVWCGEFDTVGIVVSVISEQLEQQEATPTTGSSSRKLDTVYMADGEGNMMAVRIWDGLKHHGLQGLVTTSSLISATSLSLRGPHPFSSNTLSATASDHTHFSQAPPLPHVREGLLLLETELPSNRTDYLQSLEDEVMNIHLPLHHH